MSAEGTELILTGGLIPGQEYALVVAQGLPATDDAVLQQEYKASVAVPNLDPAIAFQSSGMFLSASGTRTVALKTVNVSEVQLTIDRVYRNNLFFFFDRNSGGYENEDYYDSTVSQVFGDRLVTETISLSGRAQ